MLHLQTILLLFSFNLPHLTHQHSLIPLWQLTVSLNPRLHTLGLKLNQLLYAHTWTVCKIKSVSKLQQFRFHKMWNFHVNGRFTISPGTQLQVRYEHWTQSCHGNQDMMISVCQQSHWGRGHHLCLTSQMCWYATTWWVVTLMIGSYKGTLSCRTTTSTIGSMSACLCTSATTLSPSLHLAGQTQPTKMVFFRWVLLSLSGRMELACVHVCCPARTMCSCLFRTWLELLCTTSLMGG